MTKYTQTFKQQFVDFYFDNRKNLPKTLKHFQLVRETVRRWIIKFKHSGYNGLAVLHHKQIYSSEFKFQVIQSILSGQFISEEVTLHFGLSNSGIVSQWLQTFEKRYKWLITETKRSPEYEA